MAKKVTPNPAAAAQPAAVAPPATDAPPAVAKMKSTKPRATPVVPTAGAAAAATQPLMITDEMISERAYHKWRNGEPGDQHHHWTTAERELRDGG